MTHDDCLFCKIIEGEIPSAKVYEDEHVYAFLDISQVTTGHTLVIPKKHAKDIYELDEETAEQLFRRVPKIAKAVKTAFKPIGINLLNNNEIAAGQSVFHIHIHIIPRYGQDDGFNIKWVTRNDEFTPEKLQEIAKNIATEIN